MSIFIYYLKKQSYYICFSVVYFIEVIVFINLAINGKLYIEDYEHERYIGYNINLFNKDI